MENCHHEIISGDIRNYVEGIIETITIFQARDWIWGHQGLSNNSPVFYCRGITMDNEYERFIVALQFTCNAKVNSTLDFVKEIKFPFID